MSTLLGLLIAEHAKCEGPCDCLPAIVIYAHHLGALIETVSEMAPALDAFDQALTDSGQQMAADAEDWLKTTTEPEEGQ